MILPGLHLPLRAAFFAVFCGSAFGVDKVKAPAQTVPFVDYPALLVAPTTEGSILPTGYFQRARRAIHPLRVEWKPVSNAARYELILSQNSRVLGATPAARSPEFIAKGWERLVPGRAAQITIQAFDTAGRRIASSTLLPFFVAPDFDPAVASPARRSYREAALKGFAALFDYQRPPNQAKLKSAAGIHPILLSAVVAPRGANPYSFPNLHDWMHIEMVESLLKIADAPLRAKALAYARSIGEHLLLCRIEDDDFAFKGMIRGCANWQGGAAIGVPTDRMTPAAIEKQMRMVEVAKGAYSADALVRVFEVTGDARYLDAALVMAEIFLKTQRPDGGWSARVDAKTGEVLIAYTSSVGIVAQFLDRLEAHRPDPRWRQARDRATAWMLEYPMKTCAWVVSCDDNNAPATMQNPFIGNLSNWDLFVFMRYLARHPDRIPHPTERIREQLEWNDNQFVFYGSDPLLPYEPWYPCCAEQGNPSPFYQSGDCWVPMDFHTANWVAALLEFHRLSHEARPLAIARAAANTLTQYQLDDGRTITWMGDRALGTLISPGSVGGAVNFWPAAWALSVSVWAELAALEEGK